MNKRPGFRRERGFTLIDIIVAITVLGIVVGLSIPGLRSMMDGFRHRTSVDTLTAKLFLTRQVAIRDKMPYVVSLDVANRQLQGFGDQNGNGALDVGEPTIAPLQMYDGVSINNVSWVGAALTFFPNGRASATSDLTVTDGRGRTKTVRVSSITGNTEVLP